jgi:hypothetical protein
MCPECVRVFNGRQQKSKAAAGELRLRPIIDLGLPLHADADLGDVVEAMFEATPRFQLRSRRRAAP